MGSETSYSALRGAETKLLAFTEWGESTIDLVCVHSALQEGALKRGAYQSALATRFWSDA